LWKLSFPSRNSGGRGTDRHFRLIGIRQGCEKGEAVPSEAVPPTLERDQYIKSGWFSLAGICRVDSSSARLSRLNKLHHNLLTFGNDIALDFIFNSRSAAGLAYSNRIK